MQEVEIEFADAPKGSLVPNWRVRITAAGLKAFCDRFTIELEDLVG
jgi:hypothetical protein